MTGIATIAAVHLIAGGIDQAIANLLFSQGRAHQVVRDSLFMASDFVNLAVAAFELRRLCVSGQSSIRGILRSLKREMLVAFCGSAVLLLALPHIDPG